MLTLVLLINTFTTLKQAISIFRRENYEKLLKNSEKSEKFEIIKESVEDSLFLYLKTDYYGFDKDVTGNNLLKINEFTIKDNLNKENLQIKINSNFFDYN
jgi:hypothetical protein